MSDINVYTSETGDLAVATPYDRGFISSLQAFGSYPMWSWTDTWKPPEDEYNKFYGVSGWQRFDNAYVHQPLKDGYFAWLPVTSVRDLREYLVWSLSGTVELADVKVTIDGDFEPDER